jgi:hypothetical protein
VYDSLVRKAFGPRFTAKRAQAFLDNLFFVRVQVPLPRCRGNSITPYGSDRSGGPVAINP